MSKRGAGRFGRKKKPVTASVASITFCKNPTLTPDERSKGTLAHEANQIGAPLERISQPILSLIVKFVSDVAAVDRHYSATIKASVSLLARIGFVDDLMFFRYLESRQAPRHVV